MKIKEKAMAVAVALFLWQIMAMIFDEELILASPYATLKAFLGLLGTSLFYISLGHTVGKILLGFLLGLITAVVFAVLSGRIRIIETLMYPYIAVMKSTPVASFAILSLIIFGIGKLSVFISFVVVVPIIYTNLLNGIKGLDDKLSEMAEVFMIKGLRKALIIDLPQLSGYIDSAVTLAIGTAFKAGVAAEVIGTPNHSIGKMLYEAKIYLETPELFAWTISIILISVLVEKAISLMIGVIYKLIKKYALFGGTNK